MTPYTVGSLCTGYAGLELALDEILPNVHKWHADNSNGASKILAHHYPEIPNLGDIREVDWSSVEPVDVLAAGFPCQPVSHAGTRAGITDERWLFDDILDALRDMVTLPRLLVFENVIGLLSANRGDAMARIVSGLAALGFMGRYRVLRASDVGAPHRRGRVFIVAFPANERRQWTGSTWDGRTGSPDRSRRGTLLPTPTTQDGANNAGPAQYERRSLPLNAAVTLLPTPNPFHAGNTETPDEWRNRRLDVYKRTGTRHGPALSVVALSVLEGDPLDPAHYMPDEDDEIPVDQLVATPQTTQAGLGEWGVYGDAIARWEYLTRPAPDASELTDDGAQRLSPAFVEWMMGLPEGWVSDIPGLSRTQQLKALGNGVVPPQASAAIRSLLRDPP